ncbi:Dual specificity phosphatase [Phytophthora cinnamomi]|uniref:Dual specificity phosphatase n=1 Tax=Phytophthora cinnamomi TaxID=4785 RepID=UPI00355AABDC|nr:Dual specificity phosphatase [Phytophthora cinnamomi]
MAAADRGWYEAYASGEEVGRELQDGEDEDEDEYEEEEVEIEEMADDEPMHITGRVFLGSIDAARNVGALKRQRIGAALALLGKGEEAEAVSSHPSSVRDQYEELQITRKSFEIEDSEDADLLCRLPEIVAALRKLLERAEQDGTNVLVHCIAGRSRSASVVAAWMLINKPKLLTVQDAVDRIRIIRPWIEINSHFMRDLHTFHTVLTSSDKTPLGADNAALLKSRSFPRLDFGANLVDGILRGTKAITMRLLSDIEGDRKSDLRDIFPHSIVAATTSSTEGSFSRPQFAYLRIDQVETLALNAIDHATLRKTGFNSADEVLTVLKQFYPDVSATTPLLMLHFHCLTASSC